METTVTKKGVGKKIIIALVVLIIISAAFFGVRMYKKNKNIKEIVAKYPDKKYSEEMLKTYSYREIKQILNTGNLPI